MSEMKYVMLKLKHLSTGMERLVPVVFPTLLVHSDVAKSVGECQPLSSDHFSTTVDSAGFIRMDTLECYGESESLDKKSQPERDSEVVRTYSYMGGMF